MNQNEISRLAYSLTLINSNKWPFVWSLGFWSSFETSIILQGYLRISELLLKFDQSLKCKNIFGSCHFSELVDLYFLLNQSLGFIYNWAFVQNKMQVCRHANCKNNGENCFIHNIGENVTASCILFVNEIHLIFLYDHMEVL